MFRKSLLTGAVMLAGATVATVTGANAQGAGVTIDVLKQVECGCCGGWVARMREAGYKVNVQNVSGEALFSAKEDSGFSTDLWACHTASVDGYTVEGHVPVADLARLLRERPEALGIATPGMPTGSPGMEYGDEREAFDVMLVRADGSAEVYNSYAAN
jgi:hypothetical protein